MATRSHPNISARPANRRDARTLSYRIALPAGSATRPSAHRDRRAAAVPRLRWSLQCSKECLSETGVAAVVGMEVVFGELAFP